MKIMKSFLIKLVEITEHLYEEIEDRIAILFSRYDKGEDLEKITKEL